MKLNNMSARAAKPAEKPYKLADGGGLYLEVFPNGSKLWRLKYRRAGGKETRVSLGPFPAISIVDARAKREELKKQRRDGVDPAAERKMEKVRQIHAAANSVEAVALEWFDKIAKTLTPTYLERMKRRFERDVFPYIGTRPFSAVEAPELLPVLQRIESRGAVETAHRLRGEYGALARYAIATGRAKRDPAADLRGALTPHKKEHYPTITKPAEVGATHPPAHRAQVRRVGRVEVPLDESFGQDQTHLSLPVPPQRAAWLSPTAGWRQPPTGQPDGDPAPVRPAAGMCAPRWRRGTRAASRWAILSRRRRRLMVKK